MAVSLHLLHLIFGQLLRWLARLGRTISSKDIKLLLLRHDDRAAASGPADPNPASLWVPDTLHVAVDLPVRRRRSTGMIQRWR